MLSLQAFRYGPHTSSCSVHCIKTFNARSAVAMLPTFYVCSAMRQPNPSDRFAGQLFARSDWRWNNQAKGLTSM